MRGKGTALYHLGRYQEALDSYNKALSIDPNNAGFQKNRDLTQSMMGSPAATNTTMTNKISGMTEQPPSLQQNMTSSPGGANVTYSNNMTSLAPAPIQTYENLHFGIRIQYPSDWIKNTTTSKLNNITTQAVEFDSPGPSLFTVAIMQLDKPSYTLQQFLDGEIHARVHLADNLLEASTNATLANQPAYSLIYTGRDKFSSFKVKEVGTVIGDKAYVLTYFTSPQHYPTYLLAADKMINSFEITNQAQRP